MILATGLLFSSVFGAAADAAALTVGEKAANRAKTYIGHPIDNHTSGYFVSYLLGKEGVKVPSNLAALSKEGSLITNKANLRPGDLLFFGTRPTDLMAVGIYTGNQKFIIAYQPYKTVQQMDLNSSVALKYYLGAKRLSSTTTQTTVPSSSVNVEKVISAGMKYRGTPYEFGSNRSSTKTFDCSDFVRRAFIEGAGITLPSNSRTQADAVKKMGQTSTNWKNLKRGDLMFFMSYKGPKASDYKGINKSTQRITHVGIYLGNGKMLHTYSKASGGVRIDSIAGTHWEHRFIFGGTVKK